MHAAEIDDLRRCRDAEKRRGHRKTGAVALSVVKSGVERVKSESDVLIEIFGDPLNSAKCPPKFDCVIVHDPRHRARQSIYVLVPIQLRALTIGTGDGSASESWGSSPARYSEAGCGFHVRA